MSSVASIQRLPDRPARHLKAGEAVAAADLAGRRIARSDLSPGHRAHILMRCVERPATRAKACSRSPAATGRFRAGKPG